jgi:hypothetical protein
LVGGISCCRALISLGCKPFSIGGLELQTLDWRLLKQPLLTREARRQGYLGL